MRYSGLTLAVVFSSLLVLVTTPVSTQSVPWTNSVTSLLEDAFDFHSYWEYVDEEDGGVLASPTSSPSSSSAPSCRGSTLYTEATCAMRCALAANATLQRPLGRSAWYAPTRANATDDAESESAVHSLSCHQCAHWPASLGNSVWEYVRRERERHGEWGHTLDAGTGLSSLRFLAEEAPTARWTAVTAQSSIYYYLLRHVARRSHRPPSEQAYTTTAEALAKHGDRLLLADWANDTLLADERFDTILADYFVGSVDGFTPYAQPAFLRRFGSLLDEDGVLVVVGTEPYVVEAGRFAELSTDQQLLLSAFRLRDACVLYAGHSYQYREFPAAWIVEQLEGSGFAVEAVRHFPIVNGWSRSRSALDLCRKKTLESLESGPLRVLPTAAAEGFLETADRLSAKIRSLQRTRPDAQVCLGMDYVVVARQLAVE
jgi:hypothetical protein